MMKEGRTGARQFPFEQVNPAEQQFVPQQVSPLLQHASPHPICPAEQHVEVPWQTWLAPQQTVEFGQPLNRVMISNSLT
jgi:hypothetical protein